MLRGSILQRLGVVIGMCAALLVGVASTASAAQISADLAVTIAVQPAPTSTAPFTVTVTLTNAGPAAARLAGTGVQLAEGLRVVTATGGVVALDRRSVAYLSISLPAGQTRTYTLSVRSTADDAAGPFRIDATTGAVILDPVPSNNVARAEVTLTVPPPTARITPDPDTIASATTGVPVARTYTVENTGRSFTGSLRGAPLGSAAIRRPTIADIAQSQFPVTVPAGATALSARIGAPSDSEADLDLLVYNCTSGSCLLASQSSGYSAEESVRVPNPAPGTWIVLVDGFSVPAGTTQYDYVDVVESPAFGGVQVTDAATLRAAGSSWTVPGTVTATPAPPTGRVLLATLPVVDSTGATVTTSRVIVQAVG